MFRCFSVELIRFLEYGLFFDIAAELLDHWKTACEVQCYKKKILIIKVRGNECPILDVMMNVWIARKNK